MSNKNIITTRAVTDADKAACQWVEAGAIKGIHYVADVWDSFVGGEDGEFTAAVCDGTLGGMGKLTRLYGAYGWLELLRVHPDFQRRGLGKAIYRRYMEQISELGLQAAGMYTGLANHESRGLAEQFGLTLRGEFCEMLAAPARIADAAGYEPVPAHMAEAEAAPFYQDMGSFIVINRTFYPVRRGLGALLGQMGWLYKNGADIAIAGFRFQPYKNIHLAYASGDIKRAVSLASFLAARYGSGTISANRRVSDIHAIGALQSCSFERQPGSLITLWLGL